MYSLLLFELHPKQYILKLKQVSLHALRRCLRRSLMWVLIMTDTCKCHFFKMFKLESESTVEIIM